MNIAIVEDHRIIAEALRSALSDHERIHEIKLFYSSDSFLKNDRNWEPQLIISDLLMPGISGVDLIKAYRAKLGDAVRIIVLSSVTNKTVIRRVINHGVQGYLSKEEPLDELTKAIYKVIDGETYISEFILDKLANNSTPDDEIVYHLSPREKDVLHLVCSGRIMKEIANDLGLSIHTAQSYHNNILRKFKVKRTSDLIIKAIRYGFYNPETTTA